MVATNSKCALAARIRISADCVNTVLSFKYDEYHTINVYLYFFGDATRSGHSAMGQTTADADRDRHLCARDIGNLFCGIDLFAAIDQADFFDL